MHSSTNKFNKVFDGNTYKPIWEIEIIPDYTKSRLLKYAPKIENAVDSNIDLFNGNIYSETIFETNTNRNGNMYLMSNTNILKSARSIDIANDDCSFDRQLTVTIFLETVASELFDYRTFGFSTACKNGDYATAFDITYYYDGGDLFTSVVNNDNPIYTFPDMQIDGVYKIDIAITQWSSSKKRAVISRLFIDGLPYILTNDELIEIPNVFKELESDSDGVGSLSSNQLTFSFINDSANESMYQTGAKIRLKSGIKDDDFEELFESGEYFITKPNKDKNIVKISAEDNLSSIISSTPKNFVINDINEAQCTYLEYVEDLFNGIYYTLDDEFNNSLGNDSYGIKTLRGTSIGEQSDEFCTLTGTCINYDDYGKLRMYQRYGGTLIHTVSDDMIISHIKKQRKVPSTIRLNAVAGKPIYDSGVAFDGKIGEIPLYSDIGSSAQSIEADFKNSDEIIAVNPSSNNVNDEVYSTNAVFNRVLYNQDGSKIDNDYTVTAEQFIDYCRNGNYSKKYGYGSDEFNLKTYIVPTFAYDTLYPITSPYTVNMSYQKGAADWIYKWFNKTRYEHIFEIINDMRIELGDVIEIGDIVGTVYRLETNGNVLKVTIRSEIYGN